MIKLDDNLLQELGLGALPAEEKKKMLAHIYETLEMRVGMELAKQMTDAQLNEFEEFINRNDEAGALHWLETNFPNYKDVVAAEFEKLKLEVRQVAPQIIMQYQAQQQYGAVQQQQPMPTDPYYQQQMPPQQPVMPQQPAQPMMPQQPPQPQPQPPMTPPQQPPYPYGPQSPQPQPPQQPPMGPQPGPNDYDLAG